MDALLAETRRSDSVIALPSSSLADDVMRKLWDDLGSVQTGRSGNRRFYTPRAELLAKCVTPETWVSVLDWVSSTRRASNKTKQDYVDDIRLWASYAAEVGFERFSVGCLTRDHIRAWRIREEAKVSGTGKKRSPRTIARRLSSLSSLHKYAQQKNPDLPPNPVTQDDVPKIPRGHGSHSTPVIEKEDMQALARACQDARDLLILKLLYILAGRVGEMCAAPITAKIDRGRRCFLDLTRKEDKERLLALTWDVAELLDDHTDGRTDGNLLLDAQGNPLDPSDVDRILTRLGHHARVLTCSKVDERGHAFARCKQCRDVTPHVLRASRITHMLDDGEPLEEVQAYADHDDPATTIGYRERRKANEKNAALADKGAAIFQGLDIPGVPTRTEGETTS